MEWLVVSTEYDLNEDGEIILEELTKGLTLKGFTQE